MTKHDYRTMCAELVDALDSGIPAGRIRMSPLADRARALLDQPVAEEPSDFRALCAELHEALEKRCETLEEDRLLDRSAAALSAALAQPTPQPVAVSDRLPSDDD